MCVNSRKVPKNYTFREFTHILQQYRSKLKATHLRQDKVMDPVHKSVANGDRFAEDIDE